MKDFLGETPEFVVDYSISIILPKLFWLHTMYLLLKSKDISNVKEKINQHEDIVLQGSKGYGKFFATAALFIKLQKRHLCLYVGPNTIDASFSMKYFNILVFKPGARLAAGRRAPGL